MPPQNLHFFLVDSMPRFFNYCNCITGLTSGLFSGQKFWKFIQLSYIIALSDWSEGSE